MRTFFGPPLMIAVLVMASPRVMSADETTWGNNVEQALAQAARQHKDVLVVFTSSVSNDSPAYKKWHEGLFGGRDEFPTAVQSLVLVHLNLPQGNGALTDADNERWRRKLLSKFSGLPRTVLLDAEGRAYGGQLGYSSDGDHESYWKYVEGQRDIRNRRDEAMENAATLNGIAKAEQLDRALSAMFDSYVVLFYKDEINDIADLDANNVAGLKNKYLVKVRVFEIEQLIDTDRKAQIPHEVDRAIAEFGDKGQAAQDLFVLKANSYLRARDVKLALEAFEKALAAAPNGKQERYINSRLRR